MGVGQELLHFPLPLMIHFNQLFNCLLSRGDFCHLLITFANSLDPDQDRQNVGPDLVPNCLTF